MNLLQDFRYGIRALLKRPGFALTAVLTLALGIGANVAVFSIVNALILRPYPFPDLDRLVLLRAAGPKVLSEVKVPLADFLDLQRDPAIFQGAATFRQYDSSLTGSGDAQTVLTATVSPNFFRVIGMQPLIGRQFTAENEENGRDAVAILSYGFWQKRFHGDAGVIGQALEVDGRKLAVIGVMPLEFRYPPATQVWLPLALTPEMRAQRNPTPPPTFQVLARLRPEVSLDRAQSELAAFSARLQQQFPDSHTDRTLKPLLLRKEQYAFSAPLFLTLQLAALLVLLLATANLFNLLFARLIDRQKDVAVRTALGAGKLRLMQLFLGETLSLALMGGVIAVLGSFLAVNLIRTSISQDYTQWIAGWELIHLNWRVIEFALVLTLLVGILFAIGAAMHSKGTDINRVLKENIRGGGSRRKIFRNVLVVSQVGLAAVLLAAAALMVQGFFRLANVYRTFEPGNVASVEILLPEQQYDSLAKIRSYDQRLLQRFTALPGVQSAGMITNPPASNVDTPRSLFTIEGQTVLRESELPSADVQTASAGFFSSLRVPVLQGRNISDQDGEESPRVAVVSRTMAAHFWPDGSAVGRRIRLGGLSSSEPWTTIVGVVEDVKGNWWDAEPHAVIYRSYLQAPRRSMTFAIRSSLDLRSLAPSLREAGRSVDPSVAFAALTTLDSEISDALAPIRILGILMVLFGIVSIALSALGIYGLLAHSVALRTHEFGVRMALGAQRTDILRLVIGQSWKLCIVGLIFGLPAAYALVRVIASALYGIVVFDAIIFVFLAAVLVTVGSLAGYLPARRATRVDPMLALRYE